MSSKEQELFFCVLPTEVSPAPGTVPGTRRSDTRSILGRTWEAAGVDPCLHRKQPPRASPVVGRGCPARGPGSAAARRPHTESTSPWMLYFWPLEDMPPGANCRDGTGPLSGEGGPGHLGGWTLHPQHPQEAVGGGLEGVSGPCTGEDVQGVGFPCTPGLG